MAQKLPKKERPCCPRIPEPSSYNARKVRILSFQADVVRSIRLYDLIAQRNLAERARLLIWHSSADARIGSGAISR